MKKNTLKQTHQKPWEKPEIYIIDTNSINGGAHPSIHENNIQSTLPDGTKFMLAKASGTVYVNRAHTKGFYYS